MVKLFLFGACNLYDILESKILSNNFTIVNQQYNVPGMSNARLEIQNMKYPGTSTSLRSLYVDPGSLALRIYDTLIKQDNDTKTINRSLFQEFMKFPYFDFFKNHATKNDYLILSLSSEVYSKFEYKNEIATMLPLILNTKDKKNPCHWLYKKYMSKDELIHSFDETRNIVETSYLIKQFANDIYKIFNNRVILVKTHFTPFGRNKNGIFEFKSYADTSIPFYKRSKIITDSRDINYVSRTIRHAEKLFRKSYPTDIPFVSIDEPLYVDSDHKWGASQFHLDKYSNDKIAQSIYNKLKNNLNNFNLIKL